MKTRERAKTAGEKTSLSEHIVVDPCVCHGKPTFKGTRIMVWQVLEDVADGKSWDFISQVRWGGRVPVAAIAEAVRLAESRTRPAHAVGIGRSDEDRPTDGVWRSARFAK